MATRNELLKALRARYQKSNRERKIQILDEFVSLTGYHRKHAVRLLGCRRKTLDLTLKGRRIYDEAVRELLILLWETSDRICSKRLKVIIPTLVSSMERNGHLTLESELRNRVLAVSAATIDRLLAPIRETTVRRRKTRKGAKSHVKKKVKIRTFADWNDPEPGFFEADFVAHCGGSMAGRFIHTFTMTDIATGWTECLPLLTRCQSLVVKALETFQESLPISLIGFDTDNDGAFINNTVIDFCADQGITFTRSRPYRKNDQAWVEQKNGSVVRRLIGYDRHKGPKACQVMARLFHSARLHVNFFQPSFRLLKKVREGAKVRKYYHPPETPCDRILANPHVSQERKQLLLDQRANLDPVLLLKDIREAQGELAQFVDEARRDELQENKNVGAFLSLLARQWKTGEEPRATHLKKKQKKPRKPRESVDAFATVWPDIEQQLNKQPDLNAKELFYGLQAKYPGAFKAGQLRTFQRRVRNWRSKHAEELLRWSLGSANGPGDAIPQTPWDLSHSGIPVESDRINNACSEDRALLGSNPSAEASECTVEG
jgi:hypothetical protein